MSAHNQKSAFPSYYHDTWTLLKNYRSVSWSIEVSDYNLQAEFRTEYGCASEAVLDGLEASNSNTHLESYVHSLERSKRMLQLINSAIDLMRKKHEKGELYYWILYYTYTRPLTEKEASDYELRPAPVISELSRKNDDRPLSIAQQMKEAGALAEASQGDPIHKKKAPDRGDR